MWIYIAICDDCGLSAVVAEPSKVYLEWGKEVRAHENCPLCGSENFILVSGPGPLPNVGLESANAYGLIDSHGRLQPTVRVSCPRCHLTHAEILQRDLRKRIPTCPRCEQYMEKVELLTEEEQRAERQHHSARAVG